MRSIPSKMKTCKRDSRALGRAGIGIIVVVLVIALVAGASWNAFDRKLSPNTTTSTSNSPTSTCTPHVTISGYTQFCASPLSYQSLQQYVAQSTSVQDQGGSIILHVSSANCRIQFYVLPNNTDVEIDFVTSLGCHNGG